MSILWRFVSTDVTSYTIYRASISGSYTEPLAANIASKITYYVDNTLTSRNLPPIINTQTYFYTMTAVNDAGESSRSAEYSVIPSKPSQLPDNPAIRTSYLRRSVSLGWDASISMEGNGGYPIVGYNIYRSQDGGSSFRWLEGSGIPPATIPLPAGNSTPALSYLDLDIAYGNVYEYRIQALDFDSLHNISHEGTAYLIARVPVDFPNNRMDVLRNAFNPAKGESVPVTLSEVQPGHTWVKIYNLAGELICTLWEGNVDAQYNPDYPFLLNLAWDGKNSRGELVASGVYIIHAEGQSRYHQTRKVAVIK
ncbi:MAG: hypothetical protein HGA76_02800 [Candidatus Firestonebacteria bacterium]|nr:hypothetical protein [Candidatus Firestonebacteria bacterium]